MGLEGWRSQRKWGNSRDASSSWQSRLTRREGPRMPRPWCRPQWERMQVEDRGEESVGFWNMWGSLESGGLRASAGLPQVREGAKAPGRNPPCAGGPALLLWARLRPGEGRGSGGWGVGRGRAVLPVLPFLTSWSWWDLGPCHWVTEKCKTQMSYQC